MPPGDEGAARLWRLFRNDSARRHDDPFVRPPFDRKDFSSPRESGARAYNIGALGAPDDRRAILNEAKDIAFELRAGRIGLDLIRA